MHTTPPHSGTICSIAEKIGCTPETLRTWMRQAEREQGGQKGVTSDERITELEHKNNHAPLRANEILRKASAYFAQTELDRRPQAW